MKKPRKHDWTSEVAFDDGITKIMIFKCHRCEAEVRLVNANINELAPEHGVDVDCDAMVISAIMEK